MDTGDVKKPVLVLASGSPRRSNLLRMLGIPIEVKTSGVDESVLDQSSPESYTADAAELKARAVANRCSNGTWILAADTTVVLDGRILGKPDSEKHARQMLSLLSGKTHQVITAVSLLRAGTDSADGFMTCTDVTFRVLDRAWIEGYVATGEPMDKAGAYGVQGIGAILVRNINGSYTNVVGLPLDETVDLLSRAGIWRPFDGGGL